MILVVDDEQENRSSLIALLEKEGWSCLEAPDASKALDLLRNDSRIQLLITHLKMPGSMDGIALLQAARFARPDVQRVLVTAFGTIEDTVAAMKAGAFDVLSKPLKFRVVKEKVKELLGRAANLAAIAPEVVGQISASYSQVMDLVQRSSNSKVSVLFTGESGTGKTYLAKLLHQWSERREGPMITINCASIPGELLESELFGYEKGAFTGASQSRDGKILAASGGTLLLDEIGDMSLALQAKLLHFIQERKFFKLGSNKEVTADVRILAATNRPLNTLVANGQFREDLLYRLKVIEIQVPSLKQRKADLYWLIPTLLDSLCEKNGLPKVRLSREGFALLYQYNWPGNIRELENVLESSLVLANPEEIREGILAEKSLPAHLQSGESVASALKNMPFLPDLATLQKQAIEQSLTLSGGNRKLAASLLGVSERTLYRVLEQTDDR